MPSLATMPAQEEMTEASAARGGDARGNLPMGGREVFSSADDGDGVWARRVYPDSPAGPDRAAGSHLQPGHGLPVRRNAGPARPDCRAVRDRGRDGPARHERGQYERRTAGHFTYRIRTSAATIGRSSRCGVPWSVTTRGSRRSGPISRRTGPRRRSWAGTPSLGW